MTPGGFRGGFPWSKKKQLYQPCLSSSGGKQEEESFLMVDVGETCCYFDVSFCMRACNYIIRSLYYDKYDFVPQMNNEFQVFS